MTGEGCPARCDLRAVSLNRRHRAQRGQIAAAHLVRGQQRRRIVRIDALQLPDRIKPVVDQRGYAVAGRERRSDQRQRQQRLNPEQRKDDPPQLHPHIAPACLPPVDPPTDGCSKNRERACLDDAVHGAHCARQAANEWLSECYSCVKCCPATLPCRTACIRPDPMLTARHPIGRRNLSRLPFAWGHHSCPRGPQSRGDIRRYSSKLKRTLCDRVVRARA